MGGGKLYLSAPSRIQASVGKSKGDNLVTLPPKRKFKKKRVPAKTFRQAYWTMQPSKEVRTYIDAQMKTTGTIVDWTKYVILNSILQGTQLNQRMRSSIHISYVHVDGVFSNTDDKAKYLRLMIFTEQNRGQLNTTTYADLLISSTFADYAPTGNRSDGRVRLNREQYICHWDKTYRLEPDVEKSLTVKKQIKINKVVTYPQATPASSTPLNGYIYFVAMLFEGDNVATANTTDVSLMFRVFFKDHNKNYVRY